MVPASRKQPSLSASICICCPHLHTCTLSVCVRNHWALLPSNGTLLIFILLHRLHHLMNPLTHCLLSVFFFMPLELFPTWCLRHPSCCTLRRLRKEEMIKSLIWQYSLKFNVPIDHQRISVKWRLLRLEVWGYRKSQGGTDDAEKKIVLLTAKYLLSTKKRIKHLLRVPFRLHAAFECWFYIIGHGLSHRALCYITHWSLFKETLKGTQEVATRSAVCLEQLGSVFC